jgi:lipopolysaccharide transport system ATP-binding protein
MEKPIIEIKNVGKEYSITHQRGSYIALRDVLMNIIKSPFSFLKTKVKQVAGFEKKEEFWALRNVDFTVKKGEVVGIIGANGAGKSTLLKILSQITPPTEGEIILRGRVGSLLEVGTGFHPELTGRENIFLNGAILGMKKKEIAKKFDEIVEFAGIEKFLDTPVKYYSSGMYVRLAFSVAAHMEPDILIIDEVLAVGDAEFQKKCLDKMQEITQKEGRTILFVSHNLLSVQNLCQKAVLLEAGKVKKIGETKDVIDVYLNDKLNSLTQYIPAQNVQLKDAGNVGDVRFTNIKISNTNGSGIIRSNDKLKIALKYTSRFSENINDVRIAITIFQEPSGEIILVLDSNVTRNTLKESVPPQGEIICETDEINLIEGKYSAQIDFLIQGTSRDLVKKAAGFEVKTDIEKYDYRALADKTLCSHLIRYSFKQK